MIYVLTDKAITDVQFIRIKEVEKIYNYFKDHKEIAVDTETTGLNPHDNNVISLQLGDEENQFVIDAEYMDLSVFKDFFEDDRLFLFHNAKFDLQFLYKYHIVPNKIYDTYLGESILHLSENQVKKSLGATVERYLNIVLDKSSQVRISYEGLTEKNIIYAANDVKYLISIKGMQQVKLINLGLQRHMDLENAFVPVLAYVEYSGIYLNRDKWIAKMEKDKRRYLYYKHLLDKWVIDHHKDKYIDKQLDLFDPETKTNILWSSSTQVIPFMKELGVDTTFKDKKTGKYRDSVDINVIRSQIDKSSILPIYVEYKKNEKIVSTYGENYLRAINPTTGRIHTGFKQIMNTGRLSSGGKDRKGNIKINLQNIPADKETRNCFTNQNNKTILIDADYTAQEQIVFVNMIQDKDLIDFYLKKRGDIHSYIASKIYPELKDIPLDEIKKKYPDKRQTAKAVGFSIIYGGTEHTIASHLGISLEEGKRIYDAYFEAFPGTKKYFDRVKRDALKKRYITINDIVRNKYFIPFFEEFKKYEKKVNELGFWETYREEKENNTTRFKTVLKPLVKRYAKMRGDIERKALDYPIQGTSAIITKVAAIYFFKYLKDKNLLFKVWIPNLIHDEILVECPRHLANEIANHLRKRMDMAGERFCPIIKLKSSLIVSYTWHH